MPKGKNGNPNCLRRSNCCPGGIEEQQPVEKQLSSIPEESSRKTEANTDGDVSTKALLRALEFSARKQNGQYISFQTIPERPPKVSPPIIVDTFSSINIDIAMANILSKAGEKDMVLLQAIFLHDLVDWTNTSLDEIKKEFGASVASVVEEVTSVDNGGKFECELSVGGKPSKEAANSLSRNAKLIKLSYLLWQMTAG